MAREIKVALLGDTSSLERAFAKADSSGSKLSGGMRKVGHGLGTIVKGAALAGAAVAGLGVIIGTKLVQDMASQQQMSVQTNAAIASTGGVANVTRRHIEDLATAIQNKTGLDDQAVQSGENMLLTFTNIRNEVGKGNKIFDQATTTLQDMTVALGSDPQKQAIQLGKALNDPVKGVGALARVGVTFTEGQKKTIAAMVKAGNTIGAQKVILKELNKEFGGSAVAAGQTLPGKLNILKGRLMDLGTSMAAGIMPHLSRFVGFLSRVASAKNFSIAIKLIWEGVKEFTGNVASALSDALFGSSHTVRLSNHSAKLVVEPGLISDMSKALTDAIKGVKWVEAGKAIAKGIGDATKGNSKEASWQATATTFYKDLIPALDSAAQSASRKIGEVVGTAISAGIGLSFKAVTQHPGEVLAGGRAIFDLMLRAISFPMRTLGSFLNGLFQGTFGRVLPLLGPAASRLGKRIVSGVLGGLEGIGQKAFGKITQVTNEVKQVAQDVWNAAARIGTRIVSGVLSGLSGLYGAVKNKIEGVIGSVLHGLNIPGASPPEHAAAQLVGAPLGRGIIIGFLEGSRDLPEKISSKLKASLESARSRIDELRASFATSFGRLGADAMSAFDATTTKKLDVIAKKFERWRDKAAKDLAGVMGAIDASQGVLTPSEQALQDLQGSHAQAGRNADLARGQADLAAATTPEEAAAAIKEIDDAQYNQRIFDLGVLAEAERAKKDAEAESDRQRAQAAFDQQNIAWDAQQAKEQLDLQSQRDLRKRHLEDMLGAVQENLDKHPKAWRKAHAKIMKIFEEEFGPDFKTAGADLGAGFRNSLIEDFKVTGEILGNVGAAIRNALNLDTSVGTKTPKKMAAGGIVTSPTFALIGESGPEAVIPLSRGGIGAGGGTNVYVTVQGWVGDDQAIAEKIRNALIRTGRNTTGGALGRFA